MVSRGINVPIEFEINQSELRRLTAQLRISERRADTLAARLKQAGSSGRVAFRRTDVEIRAMNSNMDSGVRTLAQMEQEYRDVTEQIRRARAEQRALNEEQKAGGASGGGGLPGAVTGAIGGGGGGGGFLGTLGSVTRGLGAFGLAVQGLESAFNILRGVLSTISAPARAIVQRNIEILEPRNIAQSIGVDERWMLNFLDSINLSGGSITAPDIAPIAERIGEARKATTRGEELTGPLQSVQEVLELTGKTIWDGTVQDIIMGLQKVEDASQRFFLANEIGGGKFAEQMGISVMLTEEQAEAVDHLNGSLLDMHDAIGPASTEISIMQKRFDLLKTSFLAKLAPAFEEAAPAIGELLTKVADFTLYAPKAAGVASRILEATIAVIEFVDSIELRAAELLDKIPGMSGNVERVQKEIEAREIEAMVKRAELERERILRGQREKQAELSGLVGPVADANEKTAEAGADTAGLLAALAGRSEGDLKRIISTVECIEERESGAEKAAKAQSAKQAWWAEHDKITADLIEISNNPRYIDALGRQRWDPVQAGYSPVPEAESAPMAPPATWDEIAAGLGLDTPEPLPGPEYWTPEPGNTNNMTVNITVNGPGDADEIAARATTALERMLGQNAQAVHRYR